MVGSECYGMTTAHGFFEDVPHNNDDDSSDGEESDDVEEPDSGSLSKSEDRLRALKQPRTTNTVYLDPTRYTISRQQSGELEVSRSGPAVELRAKHVLGELDDDDSRQQLISRDDDWALIRISDPARQVPNTFQVDGRMVQCNTVAAQPPRGRITIAAGFSGTATNSSTGHMVGLLLPGTHKLVAAWALDGLCGRFAVFRSIHRLLADLM